MQLKRILRRTFEFSMKIISSPRSFWEEIIERKESIQLMEHFYLPLLIAIIMAETIGDFFSNPEFLLSFSAIYALKQIIVYLAFYYISTRFINFLLERLEGKKDLSSVQFAVVFSMIPIFLVSIITGIFPFLYPINILGLYGLYIFYCGVPHLFEIPKERIKTFIIAAILSAFAIFAILSILFWKLLDMFY